jgi:hypothetical protein
VLPNGPLGRYVEHVRERSPRSRRVNLIAGFYRLTAVLSALTLAGIIVQGATHWGSFWPTVLAHQLAFVSWPLTIATNWWTGDLIAQRRRFGAWIAVSSIGLGVLNALIARGTGATATIVLASLGLAAIASIWRELE